MQSEKIEARYAFEIHEVEMKSHHFFSRVSKLLQYI